MGDETVVRVTDSDDGNAEWDESDAPGENAADQQEEGTAKSVHICTVCNRNFKKISHLKQHYRSHTGR
jgi:uncharacterized Zn-finger protein